MEPMPKKAAEANDVDAFMGELVHPLKEEIETARKLVLGSAPGITERIKWNAPSFCYQGDDRVTFKLHPKDGVHLIFHRGAKPRDTEDFVFEDGTGLLKWVAKDRAIVTFSGMKEIVAAKRALKTVVKQWMISTVEQVTADAPKRKPKASKR
jgi:hypothetical protein